MTVRLDIFSPQHRPELFRTNPDNSPDPAWTPLVESPDQASDNGAPNNGLDSGNGDVDTFGPGNVTPVNYEEPTADTEEPPADAPEPNPLNPANDAEDGVFRHPVVAGDSYEAIAREYGLSMDDIELMDPRARDNPDELAERREKPGGGTEPNEVVILSDARLARAREMQNLIGDASDITDLSVEDRDKLETILKFEFDEAAMGRGHDSEALDGALTQRQNELATLFPEIEGLDRLMESRYVRTAGRLNENLAEKYDYANRFQPSPADVRIFEETGVAPEPVEEPLFSKDMERTALEAIESGDWTAFEAATVDELRERTDGKPPLEAERIAARFIGEASQYGPVEQTGFTEALVGPDGKSGALYQVMVKDLAAEVIAAGESADEKAGDYGGSSDIAAASLYADKLAEVTEGISPQRTDQLLIELSKPPETATPTEPQLPDLNGPYDFPSLLDPPAGPPAPEQPWNPATDGAHPESVLGRTMDAFSSQERYITRGGRNDIPYLKDIFTDLDAVAAQASGAQYVDDQGQPIEASPAGVDILARGIADARQSALSEMSGDHLIDTGFLGMFKDSIADGDAVVLPFAVLEHYNDKGMEEDVGEVSEYIREGLDGRLTQSEEGRDAYLEVLGDIYVVGGQFDDMIPAEMQEELVGNHRSDKLGEEDNQAIAERFQDEFAADMALDAILAELPEGLRSRLGDAPEKLNHHLVGDENGDGGDGPPPMLDLIMGGSLAGTPGEGTPDLPLSEQEEAIANTPEFAGFSENFNALTDEQYRASYGDLLDTYEQLQTQLADPNGEGPFDLPPNTTELPGYVTEILDGLGEGDRAQQLETLHENPAQAALLARHMLSLENSPTETGQPRGPSGGFIARETRNSLIELSRWVNMPGSGSPMLANPVKTGNAGVFRHPATGIPASLANILGNGWAVAEFGRLADAYKDDAYRADNDAWTAIFGGLIAVESYKLAGTTGKLFMGDKPWQFAPDSKFARYSAAAFKSGLPLTTAASKFLNVATMATAFWTLGEEIGAENPDPWSVGAWSTIATGSVMTTFASLFPAAASSGPVGLIGTALWFIGATIVHLRGQHNQRVYYEGDLKPLLEEVGRRLGGDQIEERADIIGAGRHESNMVGVSLLPVLRALAEYRGVSGEEMLRWAFTSEANGGPSLDELRDLADEAGGISADKNGEYSMEHSDRYSGDPRPEPTMPEPGPAPTPPPTGEPSPEPTEPEPSPETTQPTPELTPAPEPPTISELSGWANWEGIGLPGRHPV